MTKLRYEDKISIYIEYKEGISYSNISEKYGIRKSVVSYLIALINKHGYDILRKNKNRVYSIYEKEQIINRILLNNEPFYYVAIEEGLLSCGMLQNWVKKYKENGYNIVELKRGRSPTMINKPRNIKKDETQEEKVKRLEEENLYLKAELEYSKKLRAVVQARKNQQQKKR